MKQPLGISGRIAATFQSAQITPLLALVALLLGIFAVLVTPREEEPQIDVTMANVLIPFPGASVKDVEQMVAGPAEQVLAQISGVEHVMSASRPGIAVITVQFKVGVPRTEALVRLYDTVNANADWLPRGLGVLDPIIKPKGIDDVPIVTLTLFSRNPGLGSYELERVAHSVETELKRVPGTREVVSVGGPGRAVRVEIDPTRMAGAGITVPDLRMALQSANLGLPVGELLAGNRAVAVESGPFLKDAQEVADLVVGVRNGKPVFLQDVAKVSDGPLPALRYVWHGTKAEAGGKAGGEFPAVTISVTKKPGENAIDVSDAVMQAGGRAAQHGDPARRRGGRDAQLRRHGQRQGRQADPEAAVCHGRGGGAGVHRARPARGRDRRQRGDPHVDGDTVRQLGLGLHAEPGVAVRADLFDRHPGRRCHRGGREHPPPPAALSRPQPGADHSRRGGRSRQPDDPGHADRDCRAAADGLCQRVDGAVHEPDPDQRQHGHAAVAGGGLRRSPPGWRASG